MKDRIGVFICACGSTIDDAVDIPELVRFTGRLDAVVRVEPVRLLCGPEDPLRAAAAIREDGITHVVVAGCSPREHEHTFRRILESAGLNAYMLQTVNLREHCAWVIRDRDQATAKAKRLIRAAVKRVRHHRPITSRTIDCRPDVLVIGAGVAGIAAARTLSQNRRRVYLVERSACIGGMAALYEDLYPDFNCAACLLEPDLDEVLHDDRIEVLTCSALVSLKGTKGNFIATVAQHARLIDPQRCMGCAACIEVCPVSVPDAYNAGMDTRTAVHIAYPGSLPHVATIDTDHCLRFSGESCRACKDACAFDAVDFEAVASHRELAVGAVVVAIGFQGFDPGRSDRYGYGSVDNVITAFAFERLVNTAGPTDGRIVLADGSTPDSVAIVHCVGSRTESFNRFCSGVCCTTAAKHARQVNRQLPEAAIHHLFADLCLPGKTAQHFFNVVTESTGASLHRLAHPDAVRIAAGDDGATLDYTDVSGKVKRVKAQLVVLATAMEPAADTQLLAGVADLACDDDGFICEIHAVTDPVAATRDGIYVAGCCQGPRDIPASIAHGQAAAGRILQTLVPGETITLEPLIAQVDPDRCSGCRTCAPLCPFGALEWDADGAVMTVVDTLCRGCGICAAGCPGGAIAVCHYSPEAVGAEISAVLDSGEV